MAEEHVRPILMGPGDGQTVANPARGGLTYKARSGQTGGALTAWESTAAPGEGPPLHLHVNEDEFMYVLEGRLRFRLDETDHTAPAGSFVFIPRGVPHTWQNAGGGHARILFVFTPASPGMERFFERSAELPEDTRGWQKPSRRSRATPAWRFSVLRSPDLTLGRKSLGPIAQPPVRGRALPARDPRSCGGASESTNRGDLPGSDDKQNAGPPRRARTAGVPSVAAAACAGA